MPHPASIEEEFDACRIQRLKLEAIFNSVSDGIIALDVQTRITNVNDPACAFTGYSRKDVAAMTFAEIFSIGDPAHAQLVQAALENQQTVASLETTLRTKHGGVKDIVLTVSLLNDDSDEFAGYVVTFRDVSEIKRLKEEIRGRYRFGNIIGKSRAMQELYEVIRQVAESTANVLIEGESGTGKELVAHAIHYNSSRAENPFVAVNCSALPETLLESELFGHVKGAFTGAIRENIGRFEAANGGTLFLDEIGDVSPFIQSKLLRVIERKEFERVGSNRTRTVDVRLISATNKNLRKEVDGGRIREDLYYRLRVVPVTLPPLRERKEDIPLLLSHFIGEFNKKTGKKVESAAPEARRALLEYDWPGNIRELENAVEFAFVHCDGTRIGVEDLPREVRLVKGVETVRGNYSLKELSANPTVLIQKALKDTGGNKTQAAKLLGVSRTTLWKKLKENNITSGGK